MDEIKIIKEIIKGRKSAFDQIFDKYKDYSYKISFHILQNSDDALDNVNNAWIKVYTALTNDKFKFESKFSTWLYRIVVNEALMLLKNRKKEISINTDEFDETKIKNVKSHIEDIHDENDKKARINNLMKKLSPHQQQIVTLLLEGYKFKEIAKKLDIKPNHLYQLTSRIKKTIKGL